MNAWEKIQYEFNKGDSPIRKLIIINIAVFLIVALVGSFSHLYDTKSNVLFNFLAMPSWYAEFLLKPWTLFTYMFMHAGVMHILFNLLILYFIGRILVDFVPNQRFYSIYFGGGIIGGLLFLIAYNTFPIFTKLGVSSTLVGASGAITSVVVAAAVLVPNYELFLFGVFRIKLKWIALYMVIANILFFTEGNEGGKIAHIGGAIYGALFILKVQGRLHFNTSWFKKIRNPFKPKYQIIDEKQILRTKKAPKPGVSKPHKAFNIGTSGKPGQEEIDAILDKISQSGYDSLSKEEKDMLFRASE